MAASVSLPPGQSPVPGEATRSPVRVRRRWAVCAGGGAAGSVGAARRGAVALLFPEGPRSGAPEGCITLSS